MLHELLKIAGTALGVAALQGCAQQPTITKEDVSNVLSETVWAAARKLPRSFCLDPALAPSTATLGDQPKANGWALAASDPKLEYRRIASPKLGTIPVSALSAFQRPLPGRDCHHTLKFQQPEFIEARSKGKTYLETVVFFDDRCPTCGASYAAEFIKKSARSWEMDKAGITQTAVS